VTDDRSRAARHAAEAALVRVVHHYGATPEFVLLGGLVPELLCAGSSVRHAGTTDIDVQVDLEIASGAVNGARLERALRNAEFQPDPDRVWRWETEPDGARAVVKFEMLCDLTDEPASAIVSLPGTEVVGAANLRGTGLAAKDVELRALRARIGGVDYFVELKQKARIGTTSRSCCSMGSSRRRRPPTGVATVFAGDLRGLVLTSLRELRANFESPTHQGPNAYTAQLRVEHPEMDEMEARADAVVAVRVFCDRVLATA
jgi:hypothetical protein